jgi:hypothetical protein
VIEWANRSLVLDPKHLLAREYIAGAYLKKGDYDRHLAESVMHAESHGVALQTITEFKQAYAQGRRAGLVSYALRQVTNQPAAALQLALFHGELGHMDDAFLHLDRAIEHRDPSLVHLAVAPQWDDLRRDPRFEQRLAHMGLRP